jgi:hypothetical protein
MLAIPLGLDQPAIAARLDQLHAARVLPIMRLSSARIRAAIELLLRDRSYEVAAKTLQSAFLSLRGPEQASNIIIDALERQSKSRQMRLGENPCGRESARASSRAGDSYAADVNDSSASIASLRS